MATDCEHQQHILLLDDNTEFARPVLRWLSKSNYHATLATSLKAALQCLERQRFHLAIVDIRLDDNDEKNNDGMEFLRLIEKYELRDVMPVIVLTGNATTDNILEAFTKYGVFYYIRKEPGYRKTLLHEVGRAFDERIQINFKLDYNLNSDETFKKVVKDIHWINHAPASTEMLVCEMRDLFGKLFKNAESVYLTKLTPGLSGAGLVKVNPFWIGSGQGPARVVKVDRCDKSKKEKDNYETNVKNTLPLASTQVSYEKSQHLGCALYTFAEESSRAFVEFDEFYQKAALGSIEDSLHGLIFNTCRFWYDHTQSQIANLQELYFRAFNLDKPRLVKAFREFLPGYDPALSSVRVPGNDLSLTNPLHWLATHEDLCILSVKMCITHGDMTGRNIMVDGNGRCWMIDFLRTYESHVLRDFVIFETDLKFRLGTQLPDKDFLEFEKNLVVQGFHQTTPRLPAHFSKETRKLFSLILIVRRFAQQVGMSVANPSQIEKEYMISLLMATLNVIRLRHTPPARKMQALRAAIMICEALGS